MNQLPNQPPDPFNGINGNQLPNLNPLNPEQEVSHSDVTANSESGQTPASEKTIKSLKHIYIMLLALGLIIGGVVSVGIVIGINKLGLNDVPATVDERE